MNRTFSVISFLLIAFVASAAPAQNSSAKNVASASAGQLPPVAYIYVSSGYIPTANRLDAFAAAPDGRLTRIAGSPFPDDVVGLAVNGKYLFGAGTDGTHIYSYGIAWNGGLKHVATINAQGYNSNGCAGFGPVLLDHTGADLYAAIEQGDVCGGTGYLSFKVAKTTGKLSFIGTTAQTDFYNYPLTFIGNNINAYGTDCIDFEGNYLDTISGYRRLSDGMLNNAAISAQTPTTKDDTYFYCRAVAAADPTHHLAVTVLAIDLASQSIVGLPQLATYTVDKYGNLNTASTYANMPKTDVGYVSAMSMSPSGKLLAVGGNNGLQVFHFNGGGPITHYTGLLVKDGINQVTPDTGLLFWDNANHLYAISPVAGKLYVFTVTPTSVHQAPGSPYTVMNPQNMIVQPKTN